MLKCFISTQRKSVQTFTHSSVDKMLQSLEFDWTSFKNRVLLLWYKRATMIFCALHIFDTEFLDQMTCKKK